jgi:hypothetical protein
MILPQNHALARLGSAAMARLSYPRAGEPRPAALPPETRTVGQLVAETIRLYSGRFWAVLPLGIVFCAVDVSSFDRSVTVQTLALWAFAPVFAAAFVYASSIVAGEQPQRDAAVTAWWLGVLIFLPFPIFVRLFVLPGIVWFALIGLAVPAAALERLGARAALRRGLQLSRADLVHVVAGLATLALVYGMSKYALLLLLHTQGDLTQRIAAAVADFVLSPLLFLGSALLYVDQKARVTVTG